MELSRRHFLSASAAVLAAGAMTRGKVWGANEKINMCVIGLNGRGNEHMEKFAGSPNSQVVAVCDVDERVLDRAAKKIAKLSGGKEPKKYVDIKEALADKEIDAVSIATPNHWHTLAALWAVQAGKHVYVEKPGSHNIYEGQQLVAAAEKYNVIMQHGTQSRSDAEWIRAISLLHSGDIIGKVYMARGLCYKNGNRGSIGNHPNETPPKEFHWDLWQGPAARQEFNPMYHPYSWHWFWNYGNGEIGNQGIHQLDIAAWGMNKGFPVKIYSAGGRFTYEDGGQTPNTNVATFTYADGTMLVFEVRNRFTNSEGGTEIDGKFFSGVNVGNLFYGDGGYYVEDQGFFDTKNKPIPIDPAKYPLPETQGAWENFLAAVKANDKSKVFAPMTAAHLSSGMAHMANISYRLGASLEFDPKSESFVKAPEEANKMLTREYAGGFEVPKIA